MIVCLLYKTRTFLTGWVSKHKEYKLGLYLGMNSHAVSLEVVAVNQTVSHDSLNTTCLANCCLRCPCLEKWRHVDMSISQVAVLFIYSRCSLSCSRYNW